MSIRYAHVALDDPQKLAMASLLMEWGQLECAIPADRRPLTGGEDAIFAITETEAGRDTVIGGVVFYQPEDCDLVFIDILFVSAAYRRRGLGSYLIEKVVEVARELELSEIQFGTMLNNQAMQALGRGAGFHASAVYMSRRLVERKAQ